MQQTQSYLWLVAICGALSASVLSACVVTSSTDESGGFAGSITAGASNLAGAGGSTAGASYAGANSAGAATAGTGGSLAGASSTAPACDTDPNTPIGTPFPSCKPVIADACSTCIQTNCCAEYSACYGTSPGNICGYGGPMNQGEFACYQTCLQDVFKNNEVIDTSDRETCAANCATSLSLQGSIMCKDTVGVATSNLIGCVMEHDCNKACYGE